LVVYIIYINDARSNRHQILKQFQTRLMREKVY